MSTSKGSARFWLSQYDWKKIGRGAIIATVGALLTYVTEQIPGFDFGEYTPMVVAFWSIFSNAIWKFMSNTK